MPIRFVNDNGFLKDNLIISNLNTGTQSGEEPLSPER